MISDLDGSLGPSLFTKEVLKKPLDSRENRTQHFLLSEQSSDPCYQFIRE